jgi:ribosome-associated protein
MIRISPRILLDESEITETFVRASGPGGQNVNKVSTAVRLRFDVHQSPSLPEDVKARLEELAGGKMTMDGILLLESQRYRTQERNRDEVLRQLAALIERASRKPLKRHPTRPTAASQVRRLEIKKRRGAIKRLRGKKQMD